MTFRETVIAKPFDLVETAFSKICIVAICDHPIDQFFLKIMDCSGVPESGHSTA